MRTTGRMMTDATSKSVRAHGFDAMRRSSGNLITVPMAPSQIPHHAGGGINIRGRRTFD
jgi:hypothetical protein